jgi:protein-disulfide isomerase
MDPIQKQNQFNRSPLPQKEVLEQEQQKPPERGSHWIVPISIIVAGALVGTGIYLSAQKSSKTGGINNTNAIDTITIRPVDSTDHILGNPNAKVTIIEFSDTECPFCKQYHVTMKRIISEYGVTGDVAWVYRQMPIDGLHKKSRLESTASECASEIGGNNKFWEYIDQVYTRTQSNDTLNPAELPKIAKDIGLDQKKFNDCLTSNKFETKISRDIKDGTDAGALGTPHSILITKSGDKIALRGAQSYEIMKAVIDSSLGKTQ